MIGRPAVIARVPRGSQIPPQEAIVAPGASYAVARNRSPVIMAPTGNRLWKCRRYGNHRTVSTAPWKSRTRDSHIPTADHFCFPDDDDEQQEVRQASRMTPSRMTARQTTSG